MGGNCVTGLLILHLLQFEDLGAELIILDQHLLLLLLHLSDDLQRVVDELNAYRLLLILLLLNRSLLQLSFCDGQLLSQPTYLLLCL